MRDFILLRLQVSSLHFYLKLTVSHKFSMIVPRFTHFLEHFRLLNLEYPDGWLKQVNKILILTSYH